MDTEGRRRSDNFEDRGEGGRRYGAGGMAPVAIMGLLRMLGVRGALVVVAIVGGVYLFAPASLKHAIFGALSGDQSDGQNAPGAGGSVCAASPAFGKAC